MRSVLLLALVTGCAARPAERPGVSLQGSPADVHLRTDAADGYVVEDRCRNWPSCWTVRGTGARTVGRDDDRGIEAVRLAALRAIDRPVNVSSYGASCRPFGYVFTIGDWRDVDGAAARVGAMLAREDRGDAVMICVGGPVVSNAGAQR